jgi:hypothetical protein
MAEMQVIPAAPLLRPAPIPFLVVAEALLHQAASQATTEDRTVHRSTTATSVWADPAAVRASTATAEVEEADTTAGEGDMVPAAAAGQATRFTP